MKLFFTPGACSLAVRILVHELDLPCSFELINLKTKTTSTGENYLKINPKGAVPALLLDNGDLLTENFVIHQYLAEENQAFHLLPAVGNLQRYHVLEWLNYITTELHKGFAPLFNPQISDEIKDNILKVSLKNKLNFVNKHLEGKTYLLGEKYTLPDGYLFVILSWLKNFHMAIEEWPFLSQYFNNLKRKASIVKALDEEKIYI